MSAASAVTVIPRKRRGVELALIIFALLITISAYALVDYNVTGELSANFPYVAGICTVLALAAHFAVRWRLPYADPMILPCVIVLNGLGLTMIHRIDLINEPPLNGARQQLIWTALGVILFIAVVVFRPRPQAAAAVHLHHRPGRHRAAAASRWCPDSAPRSSAPGSGSRSPATASSRPRRPRCCCPSPSPATWWRSARCWRWPDTGFSAWTCPAPATWAPSG